MRTDAQKRAEKKYRQSKKGKIAKACINVKYTQSEKGRIRNARYNQSEGGKIADARKHAKRKEYGFKMINDWFEGCEGHHIDRENVLFIPAELHRLISHSQNNPESMREINNVAFEWFHVEEDNVKI